MQNRISDIGDSVLQARRLLQRPILVLTQTQKENFHKKQTQDGEPPERKDQRVLVTTYISSPPLPQGYSRAETLMTSAVHTVTRKRFPVRFFLM
jgi:hypothetical protein